MAMVSSHTLIGPALNWAASLITNPQWSDGDRRCNVEGHDEDFYQPSSEWNQGGKIIDERGIWFEKSNFPEHGAVFAYIGEPGLDVRPKNTYSFGPTRLVAGVRCAVASAFGSLVEIPDDLCPQ